MNVEEKQEMAPFYLDVNDQFGTTIVLIEHDMGVVMDISDRVVVLITARRSAMAYRMSAERRRDQGLDPGRGSRRRRTRIFFQVLRSGPVVRGGYAWWPWVFVMMYKASGYSTLPRGDG